MSSLVMISSHILHSASESRGGGGREGDEAHICSLVQTLSGSTLWTMASMMGSENSLTSLTQAFSTEEGRLEKRETPHNLKQLQLKRLFTLKGK